MRIINLNPDTDIGASSWFVDLEGHRLLLDTGTHPRREGHAALPRYDLIKREELDAIAISHCHHDHVGSLPVAERYFPQAHILMTELSYFLVERVLHNSVNVMKRQREELGLKEYPLFSHDEVDELAPRIQGFKYNREVDWAAFRKTRAGFVSPILEFYDAGHTLGSAGIMVRGRKETLFYTGDVCFHDQTILRGARFEDVRADVLIMETTRGNRAPQPGFSRGAEVERLSQAIERVLRRRGSILIPAFAMGRTQEILALLALMTREGKLRPQPIYIGGLGRVFTEIYDLEAHRTHRQYPNLQLHDALNLVVLDREQVDNMKLAGGRIFVVTAGMMSEHTASHNLALRMLEDEKHAIFFVGYADPETPGGRLKIARLGEEFLLSPSAGRMKRMCEMEDFDLTAHSNREDLLEFVSEVEPRLVLLSHGEDDSRQWFADQIRARHPKIKIIQPQPGEVVEA
ncbi:MAG TPA: MBL fold metallo-hydrolase [Candidatus Paceibacterota bacterium]|nr:MBL fold metallo-hydrolase [Verrucomicrobiota bacterium]HSA12045.1 MBL fold metallo-hydrolase [Candidatus Paceibacterota bacterium]